MKGHPELISSSCGSFSFVPLPKMGQARALLALPGSYWPLLALLTHPGQPPFKETNQKLPYVFMFSKRDGSPQLIPFKGFLGLTVGPILCT